MAIHLADVSGTQQVGLGSASQFSAGVILHLQSAIYQLGSSAYGVWLVEMTTLIMHRQT